MKLTLAEPRYLKESISLISDLVTEARMKATENGLEITAVDPATVAMVSFKLLASSFAEYSLEKDTELGLNLSQLKQILRRATANDVLTLSLEENKLQVTLKARATRTFSLQLLEIDEKEQKLPDLTYTNKIETNADNFSQAIEDVDVVAEAVLFSTTTDGVFTLTADGGQNSVAIELPKDNDTKVEATQEEKAKYSVEYIKKMIGGGKIAQMVTIEFAKEHPLRLSYKETDKVSLVFVLAPRWQDKNE